MISQFFKSLINKPKPGRAGLFRPELYYKTVNNSFILLIYLSVYVSVNSHRSEPKVEIFHVCLQILNIDIQHLHDGIDRRDGSLPETVLLFR